MENLYYKYKLKNKILEQNGGYKDYNIIQIIKNISQTDISQTNKNKININNKINKNAGVIILFPHKNSIYILCGITRQNKINTFGGLSENGESVIYTAIREFIEEVFNFIPSNKILNNVIKYITLNHDSYLVYNFLGNSYTYIFDISIIENIIDICLKNNIKYIQLDHKKYIKLKKYIPNIKLDNFIQDRIITFRKSWNGLNEVPVLISIELFNLVNIISKNQQISIHHKKYKIDNILIKIIMQLYNNIIKNIEKYNN